MNKYILFFLMLIFALSAYKVARRHFLSPTFLSSSMFALNTFGYIILYQYIGRDISRLTLMVVVLFEASVFLGECAAEVFVVNKRNRKGISKNVAVFSDILDIYISRQRTYMLAAFTVIIAILRFFKVYSYVKGKGITQLFSVISSARADYANGLVSMGPILAAAYYVCLIIAYIYALLFIQSLLILKQKRWYLLTPILGYALCIVSTTARTEYIKLGCAFIASILLCQVLKENKKINFVKVGISFALFGAFFLWYGFVVRGNSYVDRTSVLGNIVGYSSASLYGLDEFLRNPWQTNQRFGMYTLDYIYSIIGKDYTIGYEPTYYMAVAKSNIYTSLTYPIQDYGIAGMLLLKALLSFITVKIQNACIHSSINSYKFYALYILMCHNIYIFLLAPIGDKAFSLYLNPKYMIELLAGYCLALIIGMKFSYKTNDRLYRLRSPLKSKG